MAAANIGKTDYAQGTKMQPVATGEGVVAVRGSISLASTRSEGNCVSLLRLPADHVPVDFILDTDDIDTGTSLTLSVGVLNAAETDLSTATDDGGAAWLASSTAGQTGVIARPTSKVITRVNPTQADRKVGVKVELNGSATAGVVGVTMTYRRASYGA